MSYLFLLNTSEFEGGGEGEKWGVTGSRETGLGELASGHTGKKKEKDWDRSFGVGLRLWEEMGRGRSISPIYSYLS